MPWESSTLVQPASFGLSDAAATATADPAVIAGGGPTRALALVTPPAAIAAQAPAAVGVPTVTLTAPLAREIDLGESLALEMAVDPAAPVEVTAPPTVGRLVLVRPDGLQEDGGRAKLTGADLSRLVYVNEQDPVPAASARVPELTDSFRIAAGSSEDTVTLTLEADPCDREAGDHLDPEGVGLARYPNEIEPEAALAACRQAVAEHPDVGRFQYQLGRAELALLHFDGARTAFEKARDLGHTRAWYALGNLAANEATAAGGKIDVAAPPEALALYQAGVDRGDPYAYHALGKQLLRHGETDGDRVEGFDLLSRALELGHTFAMNELGVYFLDPAAAYGDPARGLRYLRESAARGDIYGYNNLGLVYMNGEAGVGEDPQAALEWFRKAAEGGHPQAPGNIGRLWNSGALGGGDRDALAVEWYDIGLERGDAWSGANAAWIIVNRGVPGMTLHDGALRAAKAATLRDPDAAAEARKLLDGLPAQAVDGASQMLVNALGGEIAIDGSFGPGSVAEMQRVLAARRAEAPPDAPVERALALAAAYWQATKFRVDLY